MLCFFNVPGLAGFIPNAEQKNNCSLSDGEINPKTRSKEKSQFIQILIQGPVISEVAHLDAVKPSEKASEF